jgi:hypothetical protein
MSTRREFFGALVGRGTATAPSPLPDLSGVVYGAVPEEGGWDELSAISARLSESLPTESTGDADLDFALFAAPLCDALSELAGSRAAVTADPELASLAGRVSEASVADVQRFIDWMGARGHAVG